MFVKEMMNKILIVEDDAQISENLSAYLNTQGFETSRAGGRTAALAALEKESFDLVLLDVSLPDGNGFSLCSELRSMYDTPIIFLTASGDEYSTVTGLDLGADDYIAKPFSPRELVSRIKNVLRRAGKTASSVKLGDVTVDTVRGAAFRDGRDLCLSALEYRLLMAFVNNRGTVLSRARLLSEIWDAGGDFVNDNTLTVYIKRLRDKLGDDPDEPEIIKTVRGMGYRVQ